MGSRLNYEYTDISPLNIFIKNNDQPSDQKQYKITNFGLQLSHKFEKPIHCSTDLFYQNKIAGAQKVIDLYSRSYIFQVGMLALYLLTLEEPSTLYLDFHNQQTKKINSNLLQKRIDQVQEAGFSNQMIALLNAMLEVREDQRIDLEFIMSEEGAQMFPRNVVYYQGKLADAQMFSGFVEVKGEEKVPHGVGDILTNEGQYYKGMFSHGNIDGYGIWHDGQQKYAFGKWEEDTLKDGMLINKNEYLFYGSICDFEPAAVGVLINVAANIQAQYFYFEGTFSEDHLPNQGQTYLKNGKLVKEAPQSIEQQKEDVSQQQQSFQQSIEQQPCLLYTSPSPRDRQKSRMPSSA
eukprot:TRINITY_DN17149_c0_g1_i1.p1 TRINITY_DN17149_c0_g1~~TRINITY_DN17149_c0_g1_i1.p1  ORF type:complete len:349 (-),score=63.60 TRINITY_DN17149_c0_g1_i1:35-1081(-)